jgi:peptidoglycan/xylan/chitin deacetylase (PgdA/CDA1 family)
MVGFFLLLLVAATQASLLLLVRFDTRRLGLVMALYGAGTLFTLFLLFHPRNQWLVANTYRLNCAASRPCVGLTFDDGPSQETTPRLLEILRQKNVKATFFVIGRNAERFPHLVRQMVEDGHVVGNHTMSHPHLFCFLSPSRLRAEIEDTEHILFRLTGRRSGLFRSPVGLRHPFLAQAIERAGVRYISWSVRTFDTYPQERDSLRERILTRTAPGDIVLMHDRAARGTSALLSVLPDVIDLLKARGYEFGTP